MKRVARVEFRRNTFYLNEGDFQSLNSKGFGCCVGDFYVLNKYETLYLLERKKIEVFDLDSNLINFDIIIRKLKIDFKKYVVFRDLRVNGYYVATAVKFGADFRVYEKGEKQDGHSKWLVNVFDEKDKLKITDLASKCRIAHTTKKNYLFAVVDSDFDVVYFENYWKRMN